ncbi:MAG: NADH-quinone oxidoreductase subunit H [Oligoflexia bacterium]|nr:NADH-quinone oxidoreductase subunit H [Oligoflexia bacterium]
MSTTAITSGLLYLVLAPLIGGLIAGMDRILSARMQMRVGPPIWQPFYDVGKLFSKEQLVVNHMQTTLISGLLFFMVITGLLFFTGYDLLLVIFTFTLASIFLILAAYRAGSPYSFIGAERELLQIMAYEPMVLLVPIGIYLVTKTFSISEILKFETPLIFYLPGVFIGFLHVLTIKFRKSPFDLSSTHHAHQELVKGLTTEFSGPSLALIEIAHWYENVLLLGMIYLFFAPIPWVGVLLALGLYFLEIVIDNSFARMKWEFLLKSSWWVALIFGGGNIILLMLFKH